MSAPGPRARVLAIASGKGGVGKTSLAVNVAVSLACQGRRVLVVDGDLGLANVDLLLGVDVSHTVGDLLDETATAKQVIVTPLPNLGVLPAASGVPDIVHLGPDEQRRLAALLQSLAADYEFLILDTAAGIGASVLWFNTFGDRNVVVLTSDPTAMTDAYALIKVLSRRFGRRRVEIVVNQVQGPEEAGQTFRHLEKVVRTFLDIELSLLGAIPVDDAVRRAVRRQRPMVLLSPESPAARAVAEIGRRLLRRAAPAGERLRRIP